MTEQSEIESIKKLIEDADPNESTENFQECHPIINVLSDFANELTEYQDNLYWNDGKNEDEEPDHDGVQNQVMLKMNNKWSTIQNLLDSYQHIPTSFKNGIFKSRFYYEYRIRLLNEIKEFASQIPVDYHPGMNNKVRDIVHPSVYPLIVEQKNNDSNRVDFWQRPYEDSKYQWLPSEFFITNERKCQIKSYINNLPPSQKSLYESIENAFESVLHQFEKCWEYVNYVSLMIDDEYYAHGHHKMEKVDFRGKKLQVITKIVQISLDNNELLGSWHVEGMSHENIVATATITLEQNPTFNAELLFKRIYSEAEAGQLMMITRQNPPEELKKRYNKIHIPLGKHEIHEGDVLVFPNSHIHKIDMKGSGTRTILVFWLINPDKRITSTADIAQQNYDIEKAHEHRLALMKERTIYKNTFNQRDLNLCEH